MRKVVTLIAISFLAACGEGATGPSRALARVQVSSITPTTIRTLVVEVTGDGIDAGTRFNVPVGDDNVASASLEVLAGSSRRFVVTAVDTGGVPTHRADTTLRLVPGVNPAISLRMVQLPAAVGVTITFVRGDIGLTSSDSSVAVGETIGLAVTGTDQFGRAIGEMSARWASLNPAIVTVSASGLATGRRVGSTEVSAWVAGRTVRRQITVRSSEAALGILMLEQVTATENRHVRVNADGSGEQLLVPSSTMHGDWSADGSMIVHSIPGANSLVRRGGDGSSPVTIASGINYLPRFSRSGARVVVTRESGGGVSSRDVWTLNTDGSGAQQLTIGGAADEQGDFSPAADRVVFVSSRDGNNEIYVMNSDGSSQTRLTTEPGVDFAPSWSPNGSRIAFASNRSGVFELYVMNTDGSGVERVAPSMSTGITDLGVTIRPVWSPDGIWIAFPKKTGLVVETWLWKMDGLQVRALRGAPSGVTYEGPRSWR